MRFEVGINCYQRLQRTTAETTGLPIQHQRMKEMHWMFKGILVRSTGIPVGLRVTKKTHCMVTGLPVEATGLPVGVRYALILPCWLIFDP